MKVTDIKTILSLARTQLREGKGAAEALEKGKEAGDTVEISDRGQVAFDHALRETIAKERSAHIAELKALYAKGELTIDERALAEKMIAEGVFDDLFET
jgi:anti-sigma28 factor (negative regulator of flagellin synthesis)